MGRAWSVIYLCLLLLGVGLFVTPAGTYAADEKFNQATLKWYPVSGAASYTIYFKEHGQSGFTHSVTGIPSEASSYTINYLKKGRGYWYTITTVDSNGREYLTTGLKRMRPVAMP